MKEMILELSGSVKIVEGETTIAEFLLPRILEVRKVEQHFSPTCECSLCVHHREIKSGEEGEE